MRRSKETILFYAFIVAAALMIVQWGSRTVTTFTQERPLDREYCIIIDAGHGGEDGGASSYTGVLESVYNLDIAMRLNDLFRLLGVNTKMIRTTDVSIYTEGHTLSEKKMSDLKERVRITQETENPILLSIHQNYYSDPKCSGAQVFYAKTPGSSDLAKSLQTALSSSLEPANRRHAKQIQGVYLMEHILCTGVLIECGFLSNPREEALLRDPEYQKKLCCVIASTVNSYLSNT